MIHPNPGDTAMWYTRDEKPKYGRVSVSSPVWSEIDWYLKKWCRNNETEIVEFCSHSETKNFIVVSALEGQVRKHYIFPGTWMETGKLQIIRVAERAWSADELGEKMFRLLDYPWKFGAREEMDFFIMKIIQNFGDVRLEMQELNEAGNTLPGGAPRGEKIVRHTENFVLAKQEAERVYQVFADEIKAYQNPFMEHWIIFRRYLEERKTITEIGMELKRGPKTVRGYVEKLMEKIAEDLDQRDVDPDLIFWFSELLHVKSMKNRKKVS